MQKFINTFKNGLTPANVKKIQREVVLGRGQIISNTLNSIIAAQYPDVLLDSSSKKILLKIYNDIISKAQQPREGGISRQWIALLETVDRVVKLLYTNEGSMEKVLTEFRRPLKVKYGINSEIYKQSIYKTGISRARSIQKRQEYQDKVSAKNIRRSELQPFYDDEIYRVIDDMAASPNSLNNVIAVLLATGSRFIEVLKVSQYSETDKANYIKIKGIAKDRNDAGYENKIVIRPLNRLNSKQVIELVQKIRAELNLEGENRNISDRYNTQANRIVKNLFEGRPITLHKLRYISSNLAYLTYGKGAVENTYIQQYLGHTSGDTTRTYQSINVKLRNAPKTNIEAEAKISELIDDQKRNQAEHKELREQINNFNRDRIYTEYINPKHRLSEEQKLEKLRALWDRARRDNVNLTYAMLKRDYHYGTRIISVFKNTLRAREE